MQTLLSANKHQLSSEQQFSRGSTDEPEGILWTWVIKGVLMWMVDEYLLLLIWGCTDLLGRTGLPHGSGKDRGTLNHQDCGWWWRGLMPGHRDEPGGSPGRNHPSFPTARRCHPWKLFIILLWVRQTNKSSPSYPNLLLRPGMLNVPLLALWGAAPLWQQEGACIKKGGLINPCHPQFAFLLLHRHAVI